MNDKPLRLRLTYARRAAFQMLCQLARQLAKRDMTEPVKVIAPMKTPRKKTSTIKMVGSQPGFCERLYP
jgi:hypothetical protein